jgi:WD40 repeat protein/predicted Ser/Thr protein kinase
MMRDRMIAHYRLLERLGAGGMGEVYRAEDTRLGRIVALKVLPSEWTPDREMRDQLLEEARTAASLNHPSIATIYEVGHDADTPYIAMEYVSGETLARAIKQGALPVDMALATAIRVGEALGALDERGLIHADITSSNIMLTPDGGVKVLDFGLGGLALMPADDGAVAGTAGYMSPEQVRGMALDARTDIFSLGVVLYEMVTGRRPFEGGSRAAVLRAICGDEPPPASTLRDDGVPLDLESIIRKALEKDRDVRYRSADEMLADLERLRDRIERGAPRAEWAHSQALLRSAEEAAPSLISSGSTASEGWLARARRYRSWVLAAALLAALAAGFDYFLVQPPGGAWLRDVVLLLLAVLGAVAFAVLSRRAVIPELLQPGGAAFRGLLPFQEADQDHFYGREIETSVLFKMIAHPDFRFGAVYGESGCGKTSFLKAGLLPRLLAEGYVPIYCRSYTDPLAALVDECLRQSQVGRREGEPAIDYLRRVAEELDGVLVVIVDQFEEFFVKVRTEREREPFVSFVAACHRAAGLPVKILFSMRGDFLHYLVDSEFAGRMPEPLTISRLYRLRTFDEERAEQIIERSARRANLPFEEGLSGRVARDLAVHGEVLPSELQIVGEQLQSKHIFTLQEYRRAGGKEQLVHRYLEDVIEASGDHEASGLLLRSLISDENTRVLLPLDEIVRRTQRAREIVERLLALFVRSRLVSEIQEDEPWRYELIHEYLIERINRVTGRVMDATQRANRLLRQYLSNYAVDARTRIPASKLWAISRYSDLERGERERELLRRSLRRGLLQGVAAVGVFGIASGLMAAALSQSEEWDGARLSDGHTRAARQAAFSPDGRLLVSVGEDARVIVWDFVRRMPLRILPDHTAPVTSVAFSPDGKWFATGSEDQTVIVWDGTTFENVVRLAEHHGKVNAVAFSTDGRFLASASEAPDPRTLLWHAGHWDKVRELPVGSGYGNLLYSPDGHWLMLPDGHNWDLITGRSVAGDSMGFASSWRALSPDGSRMVSLDGSGGVTFRDLIRRTARGFPRAHQDNGRAAAFSPDDRLVATGADDIVLWDTATQTKQARLEHTAIVWSVVFSHDGRWLVSTHGDGAILVWDVEERKKVASFNGHSGLVRSVAFSPDGRRLASASDDHSVIIWDTADKRKEAVLTGHDTRVTAVTFFADGRLIASCDLLGTVILSDVARAQPQLRCDSIRGNCYCIAVSPNGGWVATTHGVYASADGRPVESQADADHQTTALYGEMYGVAFSPDGRWLACVQPARSSISLWNTGKWQEVSEVATNTSVVAVAFSGDGKYVVTGEDEGAVRLWEVEPLHEVAVLGRHGSRIKSVAFSPDGREVASASDDQTIALWDVHRRSFITNIGTHAVPVLSVAFSPDGRHLASGEHDGAVRIYTRHGTLLGYRFSFLN